MVIKLKKPELNFLKSKLPIDNYVNAADLSKKNAKLVFDYLTKISFYREEWPFGTPEIDCLINDGLIYYNRKASKYQLTYKGLLIIEYDISSVRPEINRLLDDFNEIYFIKNIKTQSQDFNSKERVVLLTILGLQSFSQSNAIAFDDENRVDFKDASKSSISFLKNIFPEELKEYEDLWISKTKGYDPIVAVFSKSLDKLPIKTEGIFVRPSISNIYLNLVDDAGNLLNENYIFLLKKILNGIYLSESQQEHLIQTLNNIEKKSMLLVKTQGNLDKLKIGNQVRDVINYDY